VRKVWSSVRQLSPGRVERSELTLWVAMMGMHLGWRERTEELFIARRIAFAHGCEVLILVAQEQLPAARLLGMRFHFRNAVEHGALEIKLHHDSSAFARPGFIPMGS